MNQVAWVRNERAARKLLRPLLKDYLRLAKRAHMILEYTAQTLGMPGHQVRLDPAGRVQVRILARISADLRILVRAAETGYSIQALSVLAGIYEFSAASAYIGNNNKRAQEWESHNSITESYPSSAKRKEAVKALLVAVFDNEEVPAERLSAMVAESERLYTAACMAKHGNPQVMRSLGVRQTDGEMQVSHGPFANDQSIKQARFAVFHGSRLLIGAVYLFAKSLNLGEDVFESLARRYMPGVRLLLEIMRKPIGHDLEAA